MRDHVIQVAVIQTSTMMLVSAFFLSFWIYFYFSYEAISSFQIAGYWLVIGISGTNLFIVGPIALHILRTEMRDSCCTKSLLTCYIVLCILSLLPTFFMSNVLGKGNWTRSYIHSFFMANGRAPYLMDYIQRAQHCCGYISFKDYFRNPSINPTNNQTEPVPVSCCSESVPGCQLTERFLFKDGCFITPGTTSEIIAWEHPFHGTGFLAVVLLPLLLPLFQMLQTCFLHDAIAQIDINYRKRRRNFERGEADGGGDMCEYERPSCSEQVSSSSSSSEEDNANQTVIIPRGVFGFSTDNKKSFLAFSSYEEEEYGPGNQAKINKALTKKKKTDKNQNVANKAKHGNKQQKAPRQEKPFASSEEKTMDKDKTGEVPNDKGETHTVPGNRNKKNRIDNKHETSPAPPPPETLRNYSEDDDDILYNDKVHMSGFLTVPPQAIEKHDIAGPSNQPPQTHNNKPQPNKLPGNPLDQPVRKEKEKETENKKGGLFGTGNLTSDKKSISAVIHAHHGENQQHNYHNEPPQPHHPATEKPDNNHGGVKIEVPPMPAQHGNHPPEHIPPPHNPFMEFPHYNQNPFDIPPYDFHPIDHEQNHHHAEHGEFPHHAEHGNHPGDFPHHHEHHIDHHDDHHHIEHQHHHEDHDHHHTEHNHEHPHHDNHHPGEHHHEHPHHDNHHTEEHHHHHEHPHHDNHHHHAEHQHHENVHGHGRRHSRSRIHHNQSRRHHR